MKTIIIGNGFVGQAYARALNYLGETPWVLSRAWIDYTDPGVLDLAFKNYKPELVINCAGFTGNTVDDCETNADECWIYNSILPRDIAGVCDRHGSSMIHISSGCIFNGKGPFSEKSPHSVDVMNKYQEAKLRGESLNVSKGVWIFRIRMPFSHVVHPRNWIQKLNNYSMFGEILDGLNSVTWIDEFALRSWQLWQKAPPGIYHAAQSGPVTTMAVAKMINPHCVKADPYVFEKTHVKRSAAVLDCSKFEKAYGTPFTDTMTALRWCLPIWRIGGRTIQPYGQDRPGI